MLVDSHCHLDFNDFEEDFDEILERARANGVTAMLNAGNNIVGKVSVYLYGSRGASR